MPQFLRPTGKAHAMIKDILVNLSVGKPHDVAGDFAISAAALFDAHVSGLALAKDYPIGLPLACDSTAIFNTYRIEQNIEAKRAVDAFQAGARLAGVVFDSRIIIETAADLAEVFGMTARHYDLAVVAQAYTPYDRLESSIIEAALFGSGRPVLVVPYIQNKGLRLGRVMVCWDGSLSAARAVADALPLLQRAGQVDIMTVDTKERRNALPGAQIAEHLARHALNVNLSTMVASDIEVADVILSQVADSVTDLIVMGAYGHSRLRELVLGGVTRDILASMTAPVLMAH
jgi:nucleotide-binding universal stress UspA family protein